MIKIPRTFVMAAAIAAAAMLVLATSGTFGVQEAYAAKNSKNVQITLASAQTNTCSATSGGGIGNVAGGDVNDLSFSTTTCTNTSTITITQ